MILRTLGAAIQPQPESQRIDGSGGKSGGDLGGIRTRHERHAPPIGRHRAARRQSRSVSGPLTAFQPRWGTPVIAVAGFAARNLQPLAQPTALRHPESRCPRPPGSRSVGVERAID